MQRLSRLVRFLLRLSLKLTLWAISLVITVIFVRAFDSRTLPDLEPWHTTRFENEFTAKDEARGATYADYLQQEARVFAELEEKVIGDHDVPRILNRFDRDSDAYPEAFPVNWNRSFELRPAREPWGAIVLVHGLTDSPYSMRALAELYRDHGLLVVGTRMPGHGTAPSGLLDGPVAGLARGSAAGHRLCPRAGRARRTAATRRLFQWRVAGDEIHG